MWKKMSDTRSESTSCLLVPITLFSAIAMLCLSEANAALAPEEENALEILRQKFNLSDWKPGDACADVAWVGCYNDSRHVFKLNLPDSNLKGNIPAEVAKLRRLEVLLMNSNNLTGPIPDLRNLTQLTNMDLKFNNLFGPILDTATFTNLSRLVLNDNNLTGGIPPHVFKHPKLQLLYMGNNPLGGTLPDMSQLKSMKEMELSNTSLTGSIPQSIKNMSLLTNLHLYNNPGLQGPLPNMSALVKLAYVNLSNCAFSGPMPDLKEAPGVASLDLGRNNFSGRIPPALFQHGKMQWMIINRNSMLSGEIPDPSGLVLIEKLCLNNCNLTGPSPSFQNNSNLKYLGLQNNKLTTCPSALQNLTNMIEFQIANNSVNGTLPELSPNNNTQILDFSGNLFTGGIPVSWTGLTALSTMKLDHNNLSGVLQPEMGNITTLTELRLSDNKFSGSIPHELGRLQQLVILDLSHNQFSGIVPQELAELQNLRQLYLHNNSLNGIPKSVIELKRKGVDVTYDASVRIIAAGKSGLSVGAIVGIVIGATLTLGALCIILAFLIFRERKRKRSICHQISKDDFPKSAQAFSLKEVKAITDKFKITIGKGGFGVVYYGKLPDGKEVAVKVKNITSNQGAREFLNEVSLLSRLHHRHIVPLVGYCLDGEHQALIYAYMPQGTLYEHLYHTGIKTADTKSSEHEYLSWKTRLQIVIDAARGIEYLHKDCNPPIIHRDIKASNILLNENLQASISDLGISKQDPEQEQDITTTGPGGGCSTAVKGTFGYLDPEYFLQRRLTTKSDVFSFGVLLVEVITGKQPHHQVFPQAGDMDVTLMEWVEDAVSKNQVDSIIDPTIGSNYNKKGILKVVEIALSCMLPSGKERPDMGNVLLNLTEALQLENDSTSSEPTLKKMLDSDDLNITPVILKNSDQTVFDTGSHSLPSSSFTQNTPSLDLAR